MSVLAADDLYKALNESESRSKKRRRLYNKQNKYQRWTLMNSLIGLTSDQRIWIKIWVGIWRMETADELGEAADTLKSVEVV